MNKINNFFFNKIEKDKITSFFDLVTSFISGGVKIFILFIFNGIVSSLFILNDIDKNSIVFSILSILITFSILIYIFLNRLPNQVKVFKNYLNTNHNKNQVITKVSYQKNVVKSESLNLDDFKERIYFKNGKKKEYYTFDQLRIKGNLYTNDLIWFEGLKNWTKVSEINELSSIALSEPPLTKREKNNLCIKKALKPSLSIYLIYSLILGISAGLLEKYQYDIFFKEVNENSNRHQKEDDELNEKNRREFGEFPNNINDSKPSFTGYSNMHQDEIYVTNDDLTTFTRWSSYLPERGTDQEQISYNKSHKFLFRPYKAIIKHANLSSEERENIVLLLSNFTSSALVTNLLLLPFLILIYFFKNKKRI
jgi:hypothetical protein